MGHREVELKLVLPPGGGDRVARMRRRLGAPAGRLASQRQTTTYFDTSDRMLAAAGITVRVRHVGPRWIQTVKTSGSRVGGLFRRPEWETVIDGDRPTSAALAVCGLDELRAPDLAERLEPVFSTLIRRRTCIIGGAGWEAELSIDEGEVAAGGLSRPVCEVELELHRGRAGHLFATALRIAEMVDVRLTADSKSDRGHALSSGAVVRPAKARPVVLRSRDTAALAFREIARSCLHQLLANQPALLDSGDPEAVHQMRVALRRFRSALKMFSPVLPPEGLGELGAEVRWLQSRLGPARDGDVFVSEILAPVAREHPGEEALLSIQSYWRDRRDLDSSAARQAVSDPRFTRLLLRLGGWLEDLNWPKAAAGAVLPFARHVLQKRFRRLRRAGGRSLLALSADERHKLRIQGKQLRYAGDFAASLFDPGRTRPFLSALADLQDLLGQLNDIAVAVPRLCAIHQSGPSAWAAGLVAGWHEARRPSLLEKTETAWKRLRGMERFWTE
jgi:inorganic triphosphatase YgiF